MATVEHVVNAAYKRACNNCRRSKNTYYAIQLNWRNIHYFACEQCYATKIRELCGFDMDTTEINKNFLLLPLRWNKGCDVCHIAEMCSNEAYAYSQICSRLIFTFYPDRNFEVCCNCLCNNLSEVMRKILATFRTREMMETIYNQHPSSQNYFSYLNKQEKYKIVCVRDTLKKITNLPDVLRAIVLDYYWIFEQ